MKNLLNKLRKFNTPLYHGIVSLVFGIAFIVLPYLSELALNIMIALAGLFLIFIGILTVAEIDTEDRSLLYYLSIIKTMALILAGALIIVSRTGLAKWLCIGYGAYILIHAIPTLVGLIILTEIEKKSWWVRMIVTVFEITVGAWLTLSPEWPSSYLLAGGALIIISVECFIKHNKGDATATPHRKVSGGTIYDTDFEDKTGK